MEKYVARFKKLGIFRGEGADRKFVPHPCFYCGKINHQICAKCEILLHENKKKFRCKKCDIVHGLFAKETQVLCQMCYNEIKK